MDPVCLAAGVKNENESGIWNVQILDDAAIQNPNSSITATFRDLDPPHYSFMDEIYKIISVQRKI